MSSLALAYPPAEGCPVWTNGERRVWRKRMPTTPSEWNKRHRVVTAGSRPGPWREETVPYIAEVMDTLDLRHVERVAFCASPQTGKSDAAHGFLAKRADHEPGPALVVMPDWQLTKRVSGNRLGPMFSSSPRLQELQTGNPDDITTLEFHLANGFDLYLSWASSASMLSQISIQYLVRDECDKYVETCGKETDPMSLSFVRTNAYRGKRKIMDISTPTLEEGPIWQQLNSCEEIRDYWAACPFCGSLQKMTFENIRWPEEEKDPEKIKGGHLGWYECEDCGEHWDDFRRDQAVRAGSWVPRVRRDRPASVGFHLPAWYSPFVSLSEVAAAYIKAKPVRDGKVRDRRAWINYLNQYAALPYVEEEGELPDWEKIRQRAENYGPLVPMRAGVLTAYADVQDDRIEAEVVAWGEEEESWSIERHIIPGVPSTPMVWRALDEFFRRRWRHESGAELRIAAAGVDTGGHFTKQVYQFVKKKYHRRIYGTKGASQAGKPLVSRPTKSNLGKIPLFSVGTDTAKETIYSRLNLDPGEPGYMHLPEKYDEEYFKQLVSEKPKIKYLPGGRTRREWVKIRERNETLDLWVGNMAILAILNPNLRKLVRELARQAKDSAQIALDLEEDQPAGEIEDDQDIEQSDQVDEDGEVLESARTVAETGTRLAEALQDLRDSKAPAGSSTGKPRTRGKKRRGSSWMNGWK